MRVALAILASGLAVGLFGSSAAADRSPPNVLYFNFVAAFERLQADGFAVEVPYFPPFGPREPAEQGRGRLSNYVVVRERQAGNTVALTVTLPSFWGPFGSPGSRPGEPAHLSTPDLVGKSYQAVADRAADYTTSGYWLRIGTVAPLDPTHGNVYTSFRIASQSPVPGTRILFGGLVPHNRGIRPASSTITVDLTTGGKTTTADAELRASTALRAAARFEGGVSPFSTTATAGSCWIVLGGSPGNRRVPGKCFAGVDLSGPNPVVVYRQLWDGRDYRAHGAPAKPDLEHVWEVTVSPTGHVLSVRDFGAFPPQSAR